MLQHSGRPLNFTHETFEDSRILTTPLNRIPSLTKIVEQFLSGRPIDANLDRHLSFNPFEGMPIYSKGFDIIDLYKVSKANKQNLDQLQQEIDYAINAAKNPTEVAQNPSSEQPTNLNDSQP